MVKKILFLQCFVFLSLKAGSRAGSLRTKTVKRAPVESVNVQSQISQQAAKASQEAAKSQAVTSVKNNQKTFTATAGGSRLGGTHSYTGFKGSIVRVLPEGPVPSVKSIAKSETPTSSINKDATSGKKITKEKPPIAPKPKEMKREEPIVVQKKPSEVSAKKTSIKTAIVKTKNVVYVVPQISVQTVPASTQVVDVSKTIPSSSRGEGSAVTGVQSSVSQEALQVGKTTQQVKGTADSSYSRNLSESPPATTHKRSKRESHPKKQDTQSSVNTQPSKDIVVKDKEPESSPVIQITRIIQEEPVSVVPSPVKVDIPTTQDISLPPKSGVVYASTSKPHNNGAEKRSVKVSPTFEKPFTTIVVQQVAPKNLKERSLNLKNTSMITIDTLSRGLLPKQSKVNSALRQQDWVGI